MDAEKGIYNFFVRKGWKHLAFWCDSDSWENKYQMKEWMMKIGVPEGLAKYLSMDVFVIFTDMWHCAKAIMMVCTQYFVAILAIGFVNNGLVYVNFPITNINVAWLTFILFLLSGMTFNWFYYKMRKL